jgi:hypothetical protein
MKPDQDYGTGFPCRIWHARKVAKRVGGLAEGVIRLLSLIEWRITLR